MYDFGAQAMTTCRQLDAAWFAIADKNDCKLVDNICPGGKFGEPCLCQIFARTALAAAQAAGDERDKIMMARGAEIGYRDGFAAGIGAAAKRVIEIFTLAGHHTEGKAHAASIRALSPPASAEATAGKPAAPAKALDSDGLRYARKEASEKVALVSRLVSAPAGAPSEEDIAAAIDGATRSPSLGRRPLSQAPTWVREARLEEARAVMALYQRTKE